VCYMACQIRGVPVGPWVRMCLVRCTAEQRGLRTAGVQEQGGWKARGMQGISMGGFDVVKSLSQRILEPIFKGFTTQGLPIC
jgi:hypothetical protein